MGIRQWFSKGSADEVTSTRTLVCYFDPKFEGLARSDAEVYSRSYPSTEVARFESVGDLLQSLTKGYDIIHVYADAGSSGTLSDNAKSSVTGTELIEKCCDSDVKLLWLASENQPKAYINGFKAKGKQINLVMTISRSGSNFATFLHNLLSQMTAGETMPRAWAALVPQAEGPWQKELPGCIFFAGRASVRLR